MIPHCDALFLKYFDPWYTPADRKRRGFRATRPDLMQNKYFMGKNSAESSFLTPAKQLEVGQRLETMLGDARNDWSSYLYLTGEPDLRWIATFDEYHDRDQIQALVDRSDPKNFSSDYVVTCCEFGAVLGQVLISLQPKLQWHYEWPYWESALFDPRSGSLIPPFHWAVKKMSEYGVDDGFAAKIEACLQILEKKAL